jgi:threonine dehydrogenase-like Zn-dependent dehydrogenase
MARQEEMPMRAAIARSKRIVCDEIPEITPGSGQVLVRTLACGICGSDLHALHHADVVGRLYKAVGVENALDPAKDVVFGHEFCAEVLDYGPDTARRLKPGTRVVSVPRVLDRTGVHTVGYSNRFPGGYAERMVLSENLLLQVPDGLPSHIAALTEPLAVGEHAVAQADLANAGAVLVVGCGPVGLAVIAALKARGFGPVIAADFAPGRRQAAERLGADKVVDPASGSPQTDWGALGVPQTRGERWKLLAEGKRPGRPVIFECVGVPGVLQSLIAEAPVAAQILVVGVCMETDRIEPALAVAKELDFRFCYAYSAEEFARTLHAIADGRLNAELFVTGRVNLDGVADAFSRLASPGHDVKIIIEPGT